MKHWRITNNTANTAFFVSLGIFILFAWLCFGWNWDLMQAYTGFSPVTYVMQWAHPENFVRDFPLGISITDASSFMHIYKYFYAFFGISPDITGHIVILLEIILMAIGFSIFARTIAPDISKTALLAVIILAIGSNARDIDLAYFSHPFFKGQYYNAADFLRLMAFAALLTQRYLWAGLFIGLCFTVHPILALMGGVFMGAMILANPAQLKSLRLWGGALIALIIAALWSVFYLNIGAHNASDMIIPKDDWFLFTKMTSHWYPIELGGFSTGAPNKLFPFISFLLLLLHYMKQRSPLNTTDNSVLYGTCIALIMCALGLVFSEQRSYPILVKLCFLRANDLIVLVGLPYIVIGLLKDIKKGTWFTAALAFTILITPFIDTLYAGWHMAFTLLLIVPPLFRHRRALDIWDVSLSFIILFYLCYSLYFIHITSSSNAHLAFYFADDMQGFRSLIFAFGAATYMYFTKSGLSKFTISFICLILSASWLWADRDYTAPSINKIARDYKDVQLWANVNTDKDALFMVEPSIAYGWRAYSERSSFGTPREHYLMSWIYNGDYNAYKKGQKRLQIYDKNIPAIVENNRFPAAIISSETSLVYNDLAQDGFYQTIRDTYGVNYFVFEKDKLGGYRIAKPWDIAYANGSFIVLKR